MLGFLLGTACLVGLIKVVRGRHHGGGCHHHGDWSDPDGGRHGFRRGHGHRGWRGGAGRRFFLRHLFERLDTTPGQEKVILEVFDELREKARTARTEGREVRAEVARAMRSESFDEVAVGGATARIEALVDSARGAGIDAFAKIHGVLEPDQRARLADLIESGPGRAFGGGRGFGWSDHPYRGHAH